MKTKTTPKTTKAKAKANGFDFNIAVPSQITNDKYGLKGFPLNASKFIPGAQAAIMAMAGCHNRGCKFTSRTVTENGVRGVRIWRIE